MSRSDITGLIICSTLGLIIIVMAIFLLLGRGSFLIAGYNTMSNREKEKYDAKALCRFVGRILLPIGIFTPLVAIGGIYNITWMIWIYILVTLCLVIFAVIYANTGNRFRK